MNSPVVAFLNPPWFELEPQEGNQAILRRGIRAGSRWPFTLRAPAIPGSQNAPIGHYLPTPWFLNSAAGWVQREIPEAKVIIRDSIARYESYEEFLAWWEKAGVTHVIIETGTPCWQNDHQTILALKFTKPGVKIAVAGPPTRELAKKHPEMPVDAWILGEYDKGSARFVRGEIGVIPFDLLSRDELKNPPFPIYDEEVAHYYADANPRCGKETHPWPELTVWGSRGCWAKCAFCQFPASMTNDDPLGTGKRQLRFYGTDWIKAFIKHRISVATKSGRPLQAVRFDGDTENANDKHTKAICEVMRDVRLPWSMMCRADTTSEEVWKEMRHAGCFGVKIGFESASDRITNQVIGKKLDLKAAEQTCRMLRSIGMDVHSTWVVGAPSELPEEKKLTLDTIRRFYVEGVHTSHQLSAMAEHMGTPLANLKVDDPNYVRSADGVRKVEQILK